MFGHLFVNRLKVVLRNKTVIFWTLIFPLILGSFFKMAFSNIGSGLQLKVFDIAVIEDKNLDNNFKGMIDYLSEGDNKIFKAKYVNEEKAKELLSKGKIAGYIKYEDTVKVIVNKNGLNQTVMKYAVDSYYEVMALTKNLASKDYSLIKTNIMSKLNENNFVNTSNSNIDFTVIYFYTLIGMVCMYGGFFGIEAVNDAEANISKKGARISVSPTNKLKVLIVNVLVGGLVQYAENLILLLFLIFVLGVSFGSQILFILLLMLLGTLAGVTMGTFIGAICKKSEALKIGILLSVSMLCSFLAGMMVWTMKHIIEQNLPLLNRINPVSLITDALYSLYYYNSIERYFTNLLFLGIFVVVMVFLSFMCIRRKKYDSI